MFQAQTPNDTRPFFFETWKKHKANTPLTPLEAALLDVIQAHPEYHAILDAPEHNATRNDFAMRGETNPFLHMGLHLAVREQVSTDRPFGIQAAYEQLKKQQKSPLEAEHLLMRCLENCLYQAQQNQTAPDEAAYLKACLAFI